MGVKYSSFARGFIKRVRMASGGGSFYHHYNTEITPRFEKKDKHASRECQSIARVIDALLMPDPDIRAAMNILCRRLGGVQLAAETGNWSLCDHLESESHQTTYIPSKYLAAALKHENRISAINKSKSESSPKKRSDTYERRRTQPAAPASASRPGAHSGAAPFPRGGNSRL